MSKSWEEMVQEVVVDGRPGDVRSASLGWQELLGHLRDVQTSLETNVKDLGATWKGKGYEAFKAHIDGLAKTTGYLVEDAEKNDGIVASLSGAADRLHEAQAAMPIPLASQVDIAAARDGRLVLGVGTFEVKVKPGFLSWGPQSWGAKLHDWMFDQTSEARKIYDQVDNQYQTQAANMPEPIIETGGGLDKGYTTPDLGGGGGSGGGAGGFGGGAGGGAGGMPSSKGFNPSDIGSGGGVGTGGSGNYPSGGGSGDYPSTGGIGDYPSSGGGSGSYPGTGSGSYPGSGSDPGDYGTGLAGAGGGGIGGGGGGLGGGAGIGSAGLGGLGSTSGLGSTAGLGGGAAGAGGFGGGAIPGGGALGKPVSGAAPGMMGGGAGAGAGKGGAGKAGGTKAGSSLRAGGGAGAGGAPGSRGGAGYGEDGQERNSWLQEDEDVWGTGGDLPPGVLR
ncbi:WXG100 family type VII secretion target [Actinoplanes palleronii]|uniref:WXG100 family type VII secretion target n=1 Tax=Actinoplanes palleronii TaxID=113570 RepID=A0ABQ4B100_9ACTN|nr:hypothetical protein [Actinoplanes palleronii]GIE64339.1 hypothetical protein Apa02nite_004470 [Actinoplanes palleronii]